MTSPHTEHLLDWLRDAHAMEQQAEKMLTAMADRLQHYPTLKTRVVQHLEETHGQIHLLEGCLERLGSSPSALKDMTGKIAAFGQSVSSLFVGDEVIKSAISSYVFEHLEIASYTILIATAKATGDLETRRVCELILPQEIAMGEWLLENLPELTLAFLSRSADPDGAAKR